MMILPQNTQLGHLSLIEIYDVYKNVPCLIRCENRVKTIYLALLEDISVELELSTWIYVPVSPDRFKKIEAGEIDLHNTFSKPEDGFLFHVQVEPNRQIATAFLSEELDEILLPQIGETLLD